MKPSSRLRAMLLIAGVSLLIGGVAAIVAGAAALSSGQQRPALSVVAGPSVDLPASSWRGGKVMVYTSRSMESGPRQSGCQLVEADGDIAQSTRMSSLDHALGEPVTVDGVDWHPFTEVELASSTATLECRGDTLTPAAVSTPSVFGGLSGGIGVFAVGTGLLLLALGAVALVARRLTGR